MDRRTGGQDSRRDPSSGIVYTLKDPRNLQVKYVGATTLPLSIRLAGHLTWPASEPLRKWIGELKAAGLVPIIETLRENAPIAKLSAAETAEIHVRTRAASVRLAAPSFV